MKDYLHVTIIADGKTIQDDKSYYSNSGNAYYSMGYGMAEYAERMTKKYQKVRIETEQISTEKEIMRVIDPSKSKVLVQVTMIVGQD